MSSTGEWIISLHPQNGLLLSSKKEQTSDITESAETQMYSAKWKQPNSTGYLDMIPFIRPSGKCRKKNLCMENRSVEGLGLGRKTNIHLGVQEGFGGRNSGTVMYVASQVAQW